MIDEGSEVKTGVMTTDAFAGGRDRNRAGERDHAHTCEGTATC